MKIMKSQISDLKEILELQYLSYQSEAEIYDDSIQPLKQTLQEFSEEYHNQIIIKAELNDRIVGSVRAFENNGTCSVGKLIVHPNYQNNGIGTYLMNEIENYFPTCNRFELFTGHKSKRNLYLYNKLGYRVIKSVVVNENLTLIYLEKYHKEEVMITRPDQNEYLLLAKKYVDLVPDGNIINILRKQKEDNISFLSKLTEEEAMFRYAQDKWTIKTVIGHIADVERLWSYRLLRIARSDVRELPGYDRDIFAEMSSCDHLPLTKVLDDYCAVRNSSISLVDNLTKEAITRVGNFNDHVLSARAIIYIIVGHETHHLNIIKSKYLNQLNN
ncbi:MAG: GNAT family N-acetyltransferase [Candidatus Pristimantibacillus lignocellulolyticus]|uniref:GNAT family N-acetyltransferase n=1 Tax=Candidatus Pristimantibacillus lignocellulolyticus TaxID=2994561 RepID=A0A9J6ZD85_9BACL|nr:MAG: GNAT family N-acetyltransferase [Candidatus Pristimantibacillus lignocellulolyticus]